MKIRNVQIQLGRVPELDEADVMRFLQGRLPSGPPLQRERAIGFALAIALCNDKYVCFQLEEI